MRTGAGAGAVTGTGACGGVGGAFTSKRARGYCWCSCTRESTGRGTRPKMQHSKIQLEKKNCTRFPSVHSSISAMTPEADQRAALQLLHFVDRFFQPLKMINELK